MKKAVIIGAGQTGRGFIAPIVQENGYAITFLDKDHALVEQLRKEKEYTVSYFGGKREPQHISGYSALTTDEKEAVNALVEADVVFVSVFASHVGELAELLGEAASKRAEKLTVFCCENGVNVKKPLIEEGVDAVISEGVIFCTTLKPEAEKLDLISQDYPELPVDGKVPGLQVHLDHMPWEEDFPGLIQRKIYTYNFMSAVVAYLGDYKGYEVYGEAANDSEIAAIMADLLPVVSRIIGKEYGVPYEVQLNFTQNAIAKFQNRDIYDTIYRNARQVERKLGLKERMLTPLRLAAKDGDDTREIALVTAAAFYYGEQREALDCEKILSDMKTDPYLQNETELINSFLEGMRRKEKLTSLLKDV